MRVATGLRVRTNPILAHHFRFFLEQLSLSIHNSIGWFVLPFRITDFKNFLLGGRHLRATSSNKQIRDLHTVATMCCDLIRPRTGTLTFLKPRYHRPDESTTSFPFKMISKWSERSVSHLLDSVLFVLGVCKPGVSLDVLILRTACREPIHGQGHHKCPSDPIKQDYKLKNPAPTS